jgi:hypothetical protein
METSTTSAETTQWSMAIQTLSMAPVRKSTDTEIGSLGTTTLFVETTTRPMGTLHLRTETTMSFRDDMPPLLEAVTTLPGSTPALLVLWLGEKTPLHQRDATIRSTVSLLNKNTSDSSRVWSSESSSCNKIATNLNSSRYFFIIKPCNYMVPCSNANRNNQLRFQSSLSNNLLLLHRCHPDPINNPSSWRCAGTTNLLTRTTKTVIPVAPLAMSTKRSWRQSAVASSSRALVAPAFSTKEKWWAKKSV